MSGLHNLFQLTIFDAALLTERIPIGAKSFISFKVKKSL